MAPKKRKLPTPRARTQKVIARDVLTEARPAFASRAEQEVCGACLLPVEPSTQVGLVDSCSHVFHYDCVQRWSQTENSCPQCKLRFFWLAAYTPQGRRESLVKVERRDQEGEEDDAFEDVQVCEACKQVGDERALLLCDGMNGTCNAAYHYTCVGLTAVPRGSWFCPDCLDRGFDTDARGQRSKQRVATAGGEVGESAGPGAAPPPRPAPARREPSPAPLAAPAAAPAPAPAPAAPAAVAAAAPAPAAPAPAAAAAEASAEEGRRGPRSGSALPAHLRLSAFACVTAPTELPTFLPSARALEPGPSGGSSGSSGSSGAVAQRPPGGSGQGGGLFASFVQRRRAQQGKPAGATGETGFINLNPTYERDFMGGKKTQ